MADPIKAIVATEIDRMLSQEDPANYSVWADWHEDRSNEVAAAPPGETQGERLGQLQGEVDHRVSGETFRTLSERVKDDPKYSEKAKQEVVERGVLTSENTPGEKTPREKVGRAEVLEDTQAAFRDFGIPEELADYAVTAGKLTEMKDAADREAFYKEIAATKWELAESFTSKGVPRETDSISEWKSAITVAGERFDNSQEAAQNESPAAPNAGVKEQAPSHVSSGQAPASQARSGQATEAQVSSGLATASQHWALTQKDVRLKFPLLTDNREADKIANAGKWRAALIGRIPVQWQHRLGLDAERTYRTSVEKAYVKVIDQKRDALLSERTKALATLRGVDSRIPPHLLPSKQYRAAERLTQIDQQLRTLSPLDRGQYGAAVSTAIAPQKQVQIAPEQASERAQAPVLEKVNENVRVIQLNPQVNPQARPQVGPSRHELALDAVRELRAVTPVNGYRSKADEAMANRIVQQLQEGRDTLSLSAKYAGGDPGQAVSTHASAVEANKQLIEAVRGQGIAVDTGRGTLATAKKAEVELNLQAEPDLSQQSL